MAQTKQKTPSYIINDSIKYLTDVRVVGDGFEGVIMSLDDARQAAYANGLDIVLINSKVKPAIVKVCDYSKFLYEMKKKAKKQQQSTPQVKEVQLSVSIATHDMETKASKAKKFIEEGHKVRVVLSMKGREIERREANKKSLYEFISMMEDVATPEAMPRDEGKRTIVILKKKK